MVLQGWLARSPWWCKFEWDGIMKWSCVGVFMRMGGEEGVFISTTAFVFIFFLSSSAPLSVFHLQNGLSRRCMFVWECVTLCFCWCVWVRCLYALLCYVVCEMGVYSVVYRGWVYAGKSYFGPLVLLYLNLEACCVGRRLNVMRCKRYGVWKLVGSLV